MKRLIVSTLALCTILTIAITQRKTINNSLSNSPGCFVILSKTICKPTNSLPQELAMSSGHRQNLQKQPEQTVTFDLTRFDVSAREDLPFDSANASNFFWVTNKDPYKIRTGFKGFDQRARIIQHPSLKKRSALKIEFPQHKYGTSETGVTAKIPIGIDSDRVSLEYSFSFLGLEKHSDSLPQMGKLLGICIAECATGKRPSDGTNGASARVSYRGYRADNIALFGYLYHLGQKNKYGTYFPPPYKKAEAALQDLDVIGSANSDYPTIKLGNGQINDVRMIANLNTPGKADGEVEIYLNNRLVSHAKKVMFRKSLEEKFSGLAFDVFHGGGSNYRIPINASILLYKITIAPL
jgi:hypothetical protein